MMKNTYRIYSVFPILLLIFGTLTITGCCFLAKQMGIETLVASPESHLGKHVKVYGDIYTIEIPGGGVIGKSITLRLSPTNEASVQLLKCEFARDKPPPHTLREGQFVTICGKVDIIDGEAWIRECRVIN